ncbi:hypothetical protein, partial [Exiguobacterium sp.]|uniref:hypothetical protein n=1 Tax=Exiguobacterium sp. TaxID=44751 RepID=UPI00289BC03C
MNQIERMRGDGHVLSPFFVRLKIRLYKPILGKTIYRKEGEVEGCTVNSVRTMMRVIPSYGRNRHMISIVFL